MVSFFTEDIDLPTLSIDQTQSWIEEVVSSAGFELSMVNYIFCSDKYLLDVNKQYLNHDYYTDIITFDNSDSLLQIDSDIFISLDRVKDNATKLRQSFDQELKRVMIHGVLHLTGMSDKTDEEKALMRKKEDDCLSMWPSE